LTRGASRLCSQNNRGRVSLAHHRSRPEHHARSGDAGLGIAAAVSSERNSAPETREGASIVNARDVPGTLGCVAQSLRDGRSVLLSTHHVLFGAGARAQEPLWCPDRSAIAARHRIGRVLYGRFGIVSYEGVSCHVDCAVASLDDEVTSAPGSLARALPDDRVTKHGAATGITSGIVIDVAYSEPVLLDGRELDAPRQFLIRSATPGRAFSSEGDSGSVVRNESGAIVGLLWGTTAAGDSVACHIAPVFHLLHLRA
jgi:hypothetical protein